jgi:hypothetical protein
MSKIVGQVQASVVAGHIEATATKPNNIGKQVAMTGSGVMFYFTPDVARQWIGVLETIAAKDSNA